MKFLTVVCYMLLSNYCTSSANEPLPSYHENTTSILEQVIAAYIKLVMDQSPNSGILRFGRDVANNPYGSLKDRILLLKHAKDTSLKTVPFVDY